MIQRVMRNGNLNFLVIGHGRHGKDEVAKIMNEEFGLTFESSSHAAARIFLYDKLKSEFGYKSFDECYDDRHNHRDRWFQEIEEYNREDPARLAKAIMRESNIYCGMRSTMEAEHCLEESVFDVIINVDAFGRGIPAESAESYNIDPSIANFIIYNDGTLAELREKVINLVGGIITERTKVEPCRNYQG